MYASIWSYGVDKAVFIYGINKGAFMCLYTHLLDGINKGVCDLRSNDRNHHEQSQRRPAVRAFVRDDFRLVSEFVRKCLL